MNELDEKYGVAELNNANYMALVESIIPQLINKSEKEVFEDLFEDIEFCKLEINFSNCTNWLEKLTIFYNIDNFKELYDLTKGYSIVLDQYHDKKYNIEEKTEIINGKTIKNNYVKNATIFLFIDKNKRKFENFYLKVLYHELGHIYSNRNLKEQQLENNDLLNYFKTNISNSIEHIDINNIKIDDIYNIFTYCMYYCNLSESHAFIESINFEMQASLCNPIIYKRNLNFLHIEKTNENMFYYSSSTLQIYYDLNKLLNIIKKISIDKQLEFDEKYKKQFLQIYNKNLTYNKLVLKYQKTIQHILNNSEKLFEYYKTLYKLNVNFILEHCFAENFDIPDKYVDMSMPLYE